MSSLSSAWEPHIASRSGILNCLFLIRACTWVMSTAADGGPVLSSLSVNERQAKQKLGDVPHPLCSLISNRTHVGLLMKTGLGV